jgi:hypothetical protein
MSEPAKLRELAAWYRGFAERAANSWIWEARLQTAEDLEAEATRTEASQASQKQYGDRICRRIENKLSESERIAFGKKRAIPMEDTSRTGHKQNAK